LTDLPLAFLGMFESLRMGPTFSRGRREERSGHVRSLTVSSSLVVALVRGPEDPVAFRSRIAVRSFGASDWSRVEKALVSEARFVASLLDGRMPDGIEAVFAEAGLGLLPLSLDEIALDCTCERWPMPCVHLAATCYALARAFEADPFEVFTWRGRSRDELLMRLRRLRESAAVAALGSTPPGSASSSSASPSSASSSSSPSSSSSSASTSSSSSSSLSSSPEWQRPLVDPADPAAFWGIETPRAVEKPAGVRPDALLDQLDAPHLSHHGKPIVEVLRPAYAALPDDA
jgi:uncharacterized Zn finger protein